MAKRRQTEDEEGKNWTEAELVMQFGLKRIATYQTPLMQEWLNTPPPELDALEQQLFERKLHEAAENISGWSEEDLKMKFIAFILDLGHIRDENGVVGFFDKAISANVEGVLLRVKTDFMLAKGFLDLHQNPYFHFQEYKPNKKPTRDSMGQLLEAFLIGQAKNQKPIPLYGAEIVGKNWTFVVMEGHEYCLSPTFIATQKDDLLKIIAMLRQFRHILFTRLID